MQVLPDQTGRDYPKSISNWPEDLVSWAFWGFAGFRACKALSLSAGVACALAWPGSP
jgi:hypothetical protein